MDTTFSELIGVSAVHDIQDSAHAHLKGTILITDMIDVLIIDFGSQYTQLIYHILFYQLGVNVQLATPSDASYPDSKAVILSGGPYSVRPEDLKFLRRSVPILGICYGSQLIIHGYNGSTHQNKHSQYGATEICCVDHPLFHNVPRESTVWMSHADTISVPDGLSILAQSIDTTCTPCAWGSDTDQIYGLLFHPEVQHTEHGTTILRNFLSIADIQPSPTDINKLLLEKSQAALEHIDAPLLLALSGGVDSSTLAYLIHSTTKNRTSSQCHFLIIDTGLMREGEMTEIVNSYDSHIRDSIVVVDESQRFISELVGITDPEAKRKIIGRTFIEVIQSYTQRHPEIRYLVQGTIYPDVIESGALPNSQIIKSHHNVGGLPKDLLSLELVEPLRYYFKDDVRRLARLLSVPEQITNRRPFPGPGLAIRIIGEVTEQALGTVRHADAILRECLTQDHVHTWQAAAILVHVKTVGVKGDNRTYQDLIAIRAVDSVNGMTATPTDIPFSTLQRTANRITNEVPDISRVVYDLSSKPPSTIEWE